MTELAIHIAVHDLNFITNHETIFSHIMECFQENSYVMTITTESLYH